MTAKYMAAMKWILEHCNKTMKQIILSFWTTWQCRCPLERLEFPHTPTASKQLNHCILERWTLPMTCCGDWIRSVFRLNGIILGEAPKKQNRPKRNLDSLRLDGVDARPSSHPLVSQIMLTSTSCWAHRPRREDERRCWSPGFLKNNALTGTATYSV